jgi:2-alkyl-3-oxoalkanoate reductase
MGRDFSSSQSLIQAGAEPVQADLRDCEAVFAACRNLEAVCHVGALSAPWGKREDFYSINVQGTQHVIEACKTEEVRRLVHVSSPAVVFDGSDQFNIPDQVPYPARLTSLYALTKKLAEEAVLAAKNDLEVIVIRPKAVYGEGDTSLLPRLIDAAKAGRLPQIGDGQNRVDLTHVDDVVQSLVLALERPLPNTDFPVYTITGGQNVLLWEAIREVLQRLGIPNKLRKIPLELILPAAALMEFANRFTGREPRITRYSALILARHQTYDIRRAKADLGYAPRVSLEEGLERTVAAIRAGS